MPPSSKEELREFARALAPYLVEEVRALNAPTAGVVRGNTALAKFFRVTPKTIRRRLKAKKIPVCGYDERTFRGKLVMIPICRISDLRASQEQLSPSKKQ